MQLYEAALNVVLFLVLRHVYPRRRWDGQVVVTYMTGYAAIRFVTETFRGDRGQRFEWLGLSSAQWVSLTFIVAAAAVFARARKRKAVRGDAA